MRKPGYVARLGGLIFISHIALSTASPAQPLQIGILVGGGHSSLSYSDPLDGWSESGKLAVDAMVFTIIPLGPGFEVQTGLRYSRIGNDVDFEVVNPPVSGNFGITQHYLSVPARLRYPFRDTPVYVMAGPEADYLLSAAISQHAQGTSQSSSITQSLRRLNLVVTGGVGYVILAGERRLYIEGLYGHGFTNVADSDQWTSNWTTREITLNVGLLLF